MGKRVIDRQTDKSVNQSINQSIIRVILLLTTFIIHACIHTFIHCLSLRLIDWRSCHDACFCMSKQRNLQTDICTNSENWWWQQAISIMGIIRKYSSATSIWVDERSMDRVSEGVVGSNWVPGIQWVMTATTTTTTDRSTWPSMTTKELVFPASCNRPIFFLCLEAHTRPMNLPQQLTGHTTHTSHIRCLYPSLSYYYYHYAAGSGYYYAPGYCLLSGATLLLLRVVAVYLWPMTTLAGIFRVVLFIPSTSKLNSELTLWSMSSPFLSGSLSPRL